MLLEVSTEVAAPIDTVWQVLTDWERQPEWMVDALAVEVLTPYREGVGVTIRCPTSVLGFTVDDVMRVTAWEPPMRLEVRHLGRVIAGSGVFLLRPTGAGTVLTWREEIVPPLGALGAWGAQRLVLPVVRRLFQRSLDNLAARSVQAAGAAGG